METVSSGIFSPVLVGVKDFSIFSATYTKIGKVVQIQIRAAIITDDTKFHFKIQNSSLPVPMDTAISGFISGSGNDTTFFGDTYNGHFQITGTSCTSGPIDASIFGVYYCTLDLLRDAFMNAIPANKLGYSDIHIKIAARKISEYFRANINEPLKLDISHLKIEDIVAINDKFESLHFIVGITDSTLTATPP